MAKASGWHRKRNTAAERARTAQYASPEHRRMRKALKAEVDAGRAVCCRCRRPILPGSRWHADHNDARTGYLGAAHEKCNLSAAAVKGARKRNGPPGPTRVRL
jgi:hypothetical protein